MRKRLLMVLIIGLTMGVSYVSGQNQESKEISQELLTKYCWEYNTPNILKGVTNLVIFNGTEYIDYYFENGKVEKYSKKYYLSDHKEEVFNESKVGKVNKGKFIVVNWNKFIDIKKTLNAVSYVPVEFSEQKLILAPKTRHLMRNNPTDNYIARPLNYLDEKLKECTPIE